MAASIDLFLAGKEHIKIRNWGFLYGRNYDKNEENAKMEDILRRSESGEESLSSDLLNFLTTQTTLKKKKKKKTNFNSQFP